MLMCRHACCRRCADMPMHPSGSSLAEYGRFFLGWYSGLLIQHADRLLGAARQVRSAACYQFSFAATGRAEGLACMVMHCTGIRFLTSLCIPCAAACLPQVLSARCRPRTMREARELSDGGMLYVFEPAVQLGIKLAGVHWCAGDAGLSGCCRAASVPGAVLEAVHVGSPSCQLVQACYVAAAGWLAGWPAFGAQPAVCPTPPPALARWFKSRAHAAELTAGYYNTRERNGYLPIFEMLKRHSATASFTCVEMRDCEHPIEGRCSPEGLLNQVRNRAGRWRAGWAVQRQVP